MSKEAPVATVVEDKRDALSRKFSDNYKAYFNRLAAIGSVPIEDRMKRPIHSSVYFREFPLFQTAVCSLGFLFLVLRKLPLVNPAARVIVFLYGVDWFRGRAKFLHQVTEDDINEISCFDLMKEKLLTWKGIRLPDFVLEHEDWYIFNKPAYRVPVGYEASPDSLARYVFLNRARYAQRDTKWHGEWEQENALNMDVKAPHNDHWLTPH